MHTQPQTDSAARRAGSLQRVAQTLQPLLRALGLVPAGDPLPELSQWRRRHGIHAVR